jgi:DNA-directed RNA polymerase specialized sigma24 family protein
MDESLAFIETHTPEMFRVAYALLACWQAEQAGVGAQAETIAREATVAVLRRAQHNAADRLSPGDRLARQVIQTCRRLEEVTAIKAWLRDTYNALRDSVNEGAVESGAASYSSGGLWGAVQRLGRAERLAIILHYFHDYSISRVAVLTGWNEGAVRAKLRAARGNIDNEMAGIGALLGAFDAGGINHTQARHLAQTAADQALSNPEWLMLQGHLAGCAACRAYCERLQSIERDLHRALQAHLAPPQGAARQVVERTVAAYQAVQR